MQMDLIIANPFAHYRYQDSSVSLVTRLRVGQQRLGLVIGFIAHLCTQLVITGNYSDIINLHIYSSLLHTLVFSVCYTLH
jgi:hypothetical protein